MKTYIFALLLLFAPITHANDKIELKNALRKSIEKNEVLTATISTASLEAKLLSLRLLRGEMEGVRWIRAQEVWGPAAAGAIGLVSIPTVAYSSYIFLLSTTAEVGEILTGDIFKTRIRGNKEQWIPVKEKVMFFTVAETPMPFKGVIYASNVLKRMVSSIPGLGLALAGGSIAVIASAASVAIILPETQYESTLNYIDKSIHELESTLNLRKVNQ